MKYPHIGPPLFTAATAVYKNSPGLAETFMVYPKFDEPYSMARVVGATLHVPRNCVPKGEDRTIAFPPLPAINCKKPPRSKEQAEALEKSVALLLQGIDHCIEAPTGFGKCERKGSLVVMANGTTKKVEDVVVGDRLAGPHGARTVLSLGSGVDPMVKVTPIKGEPFYVNEDHILSLKRTKFFQKNGNGKGGKWVGGEIANISVKEYLKTSANFKHLHKLWRSGPVEFETNTVLPLDPYLVGVLLGDGSLTCSNLTVCKKDIELVEWVTEWANNHKCYLTTRPSGWYIASAEGNTALRDSLGSLGMLGKKSIEKAVPPLYKSASVDERLQLIAGMLDTDGSLRHDKSCYDWLSGSKQLADDFAFVCRSVGLAAYISEQTKGIKSSGFTGAYWRVSVSGDTERIPCKIKRKQAQPRKQKKDWLVTGFTVEKADPDEYYGFTLDGDHLYLMGDFTVTHNTYLGCEIANRIGQPTLIVVTKQDLMKQWYDTLVNLIGVAPSDIGHIQGSKLNYKGKRFTLAMIHSLVIDGKYDKEVFNAFGMVVWDEVHRLAAETFEETCQLFPAKYRLGLTATPNRSDGKWQVIEAHLGPVLVKGTSVPMSPKVLVKKTGWKLPVYKQYDPVTGTNVMQKMQAQAGKLGAVVKRMGANEPRNAIIVRFTRDAFKAGRTTVIMSEQIDSHLKKLEPMLIKAGIPPIDIGYYISKDQSPHKRVILATYAMCSEGTNFEDWDSLVLATPRASAKQAIGRVMRFKEGKKTPVVLDLRDDDPLFEGYYFSRLKEYHQVNAEIVQV